MKLNQFIWNNYKESKEGKETIKFFEEGYLDKILRKYVEEKNKDLDYCTNFIWQITELSIIPEDIELKDFYRHILDKGLKGFDEKGKKEYEIFYTEDYDYILSMIEPLSFSLFSFQDKNNKNFYVPYLFQLNFAKLQKIADTFDVELPRVPLRKNKRERAEYYLEFCRIWKEFAKSNQLTIFELCAFLYDFAPKYIGDEETQVLPEPTNIWLCGGSKGDYQDLISAKKGTTYFWQGNQDTQKGDIIVMYCLSPRSSIEFIARATNNGIRDPFFHYYGSITLGHIQRIEPLTLAEIKSDEHLKQIPIVRKNFQGVNGTRLNNDDYKYILELLAKKGQEISMLPQLSSVNFSPNESCKNEREVEIQIVEPFLKEIGYSENEWIRQLPVRMGRGERNYPDYAFFAETKKGYESAKMLLETKFFIKSNAELEETFQQAHSYALRLNAKKIVVCDKDYLWIHTKRNGYFDRTKYIKYNWQEIKNPDIFNKIKKEIGIDFIEK
ncbi:restriction endonuclease subunit R [Capnocytophaga canis]|uniref:restriction endonuclease subunit R n=1 Tax=Capnocytophaga canis TaxID=1848903 RepID=UPI0037D5804B